MMDRKSLIKISCLLLAFVGVSCSTKKEKEDFVSEKVTVEYEKWNKNNFVLENFLLLENSEESHFIDLQKLKIKGDKIYVLDRYNQHKLFVFNSDGSFINAILLDQDNKTEEEKNTIWDFDVDSQGQIVLFDDVRSELFFYDADGALLTSKKLSFNIDAFACLENGGCLFSVKKDGGLKEQPKVVVTDKGFNMLKSYFSYTENSKDNKTSKFLFRDSPQGFVYNKAVDDFVVLFDKVNGEVVKIYSIDFGKQEMPQEIKDDYSLYQGGELTKYYCMYQTPFLMSNMLVGNMYVKRRNGLFAYDLNKKKSAIKSFKPGSLSFRDLNFPSYVLNNSTVVSYLDPRLYTVVNDRHKLDSVAKNHIKQGGSVLLFFKLNLE